MNLATAKIALQNVTFIKQNTGNDAFVARTETPVDLTTVRQQVEAIGYLISRFEASTDNCLVDA